MTASRTFARPVRWVALAVAALSVTCQEPTAPNALAQILVVGPASLHVGDQVTYHATLRDAQGDTLPSSGVQWSSSDPNVVFIDLTGHLVAIAPGRATIRATESGKQGTEDLAVTVAPVVQVQVTPTIDSVFTGATLQLQVVLLDSAGRTLTSRVVTWRSSDTTKGMVSDSGLVTARQPGSFTVTATSEGVAGGAFLNSQQHVLSVTLPDSFNLGFRHKVLFIPALLGSSGGQLAGRPVAWSSSDTSIATIDNTGLVTPVRLGVTVIRATSTALSDSCLVRIVPEPLASLQLFANDPVAGRVDTIHAVPNDHGNQFVFGAPIVWTSSDTTVLTVTPALPDNIYGLVTGHRAGTATVHAAANGITAQIALTVTLPIGGVRFLQDTLVLPVGEATQIPVVTKDTAGGVHTFQYDQDGVRYTTSDTTIATVGGGILHGVKAGHAVITAVLTGTGGDSATIVVVPAGTRSVSWNPPTISADNYDSVVVQVFWDTTGGGGEPPPRTVSFMSSDTSILAPPGAFLLSGSAAVAIHSRRGGSALLTVSTDSTSKTLGVQVFPQTPIRLQLAPKPSIVRVGDSVALSAVVTAANGPHQFPVTFSVSDSSKASVTGAGVTVFKAAGAVTVRARNGSLSDSFTVEIASVSAMHIDSIAPAVLRPGGGAVIYGSGFAPGAATVTVGGAGAAVGTATATAVSVTLPPNTVYPCNGTQVTTVTVASGGQIAADSAQLAVADTLALAVGVAQQVAAGATACRVVTQPAAVYRITVVNASSAADTFELRTAGSTVPPLTGPIEGPAAPAVPWNRALDSLAPEEQRHLRILAGNRAHAARYGSPVAALRAARTAGGTRPTLSPGATVNGIAQIRIPRIDLPDYCSAYTSIQARLVYTGAHVRVYEDVTALLAGTMDSALVLLARQFDSADFPLLQANFGNPLLLDGDLDASGKVTLVFSPVVNGFGATGVTTDCDFYPESIAPSSNTTEIIYGPTPDAYGEGYATFTVNAWLWQEPSAMIHEAKHLVSYAYHLANAGSFEDPWLEEGTAYAAQEIWARGLYGTTWKGDASYQSSLFCDVRPGYLACGGRPAGMFNAFAEFYGYAANHENTTPLGPVSPTDATFSGSGWAYLRWALDQYAGSEAHFTALNQETVLTGTDNLAARTGHANVEMLSDWFTMWTVGGQGGANPRLAFPSWDLKGVWAGMATDFPGSFLSFPSAPRTFTATDSLFVDPVGPVPPGSGGYFQVTNGSATPLILRVSGPGGTTLPPGVVLQYLRIQ